QKDLGEDQIRYGGDLPVAKGGPVHVLPLSRGLGTVATTGRILGQGTDPRPRTGPKTASDQPTLELGSDPAFPLYQTGRHPSGLLFFHGSLRAGGTGTAFRLLRILHPSRILPFPMRTCGPCRQIGPYGTGL